MKEKTFIFWKWKSHHTYGKSYIQAIIETPKGKLLELADSTLGTEYPTRVLAEDIDILIPETPILY